MGFSIGELIIIVLVALIVIGPRKLPDVASSLGKGYAEFKKAFNDLKNSVDLSNEDNSKFNKTYKPVSEVSPQVSANLEDTETVSYNVRARRGSLVNPVKSDLPLNDINTDVAHIKNSNQVLEDKNGNK